MGSDTCPSEQQLHDFQLGNLPEPLLTDVAEHLETCIKCETVAQRLDKAVDPIVAAIRTPSGRATPIPVPAPTRYVGPPQAGPPPAAPAQARPAQAASEPAPTITKTDGASFPFLKPAVQPDEIGRLGNFRVLRLLGKGGMAFVFHAEDLALRRPLALKVMKPELNRDQDIEGWQRFLREARIMASIKHEHLVTVFQAGQEGEVVFLAMEMLEGQSLDEWLEHVDRRDSAEILRIGREITSGLDVIHKHGLIHRDVKPANLWLEAPAGHVKILDFGLARFVNDDANLTRGGTVMGTPAFMSPEQARGDVVDARTDLFSLGCVLYCLCTGKKPFDSDNTMAVLTALAVSNPRPVQELNPALPRELSDLVMELLEKDPSDRPQSAAEVLTRLREIESELESLQPARRKNGRSGRQRRTKKAPSRKRRWFAIGLGLMLLLAVVVFAGPLLFSGFLAPVYSPVPGAFYLSEMMEREPENWPFDGPLPPMGPPRLEPFHWPPAKGGARVIIRDRVSLHGIWMHLPHPGGKASISYDLNKEFKTFHSEVSLNDGPGECSPLTFTVYGDGRQLWISRPVLRQSDIQSCTVSVSGVDKLTIEVSGRHAPAAHAAWIEPYVAK